MKRKTGKIFKYTQYIKENKNFEILNLKDIINKYNKDIYFIKNELNNIFLNQRCAYYTFNNNLRSEIIKKISVDLSVLDDVDVYFNNYLVDININVKIIESTPVDEKIEIVGFPSGEVIFIGQDEYQTLLKNNIVKDNGDYIMFYDMNYHNIKKTLNPSYERPKKNYNIGDSVVCRGISGNLNVSSRIGKIVNKIYKNGENRYLISFLLNFNPSLMEYNTWWVDEKNIKSKHDKDLDVPYKINKINKINDMEDHEVDDYYHIRQLFTGSKKEVKIGDNIFVKNNALGVYDEKTGGFKDIWFEMGHNLGEVDDIKYIKNHLCVLSSVYKKWYKLENITIIKYK